MELHSFRSWRNNPTCSMWGFMAAVALVAGTIITVSIQRQIRLSEASLAGGKRGTRGQILSVEAEFRHRGDLQPPLPWVSLLPFVCKGALVCQPLSCGSDSGESPAWFAARGKCINFILIYLIVRPF